MTGQEWIRSLKNLTPRDRRLLERCVWTLDHNIIREENTPWAPLRGIAPSLGPYLGVWNWDSAFHAFALRHYDPELAREQLEIMLSVQLEDGRISDSVWANGRIVKENSKPPIWPVACKLIDQVDPDLPWLERVYQKFQLWEAFWKDKRMGEGEELYHYDSDEDGPSYDHERYKKEYVRECYAKFESGMDTSARWAKNNVNQIWAIA